MCVHKYTQDNNLVEGDSGANRPIYLNSSTPEHTEVPPTGHATHGILHILSCSQCSKPAPDRLVLWERSAGLRKPEAPRMPQGDRMLALGSAERYWDPQPPGVLKEAEIKQLAQDRNMGRATQEGSQQAIQPQCW